MLGSSNCREQVPVFPLYLKEFNIYSTAHQHVQVAIIGR